MSFRFASLGSGSRGNATVIEAGETRVLVEEHGGTCTTAAADLGSFDSVRGVFDQVLQAREASDEALLQAMTELS